MRIGLLIYGSLDTVSGGYLYDRMLVDHLRRKGDQVEIVSLSWRSYLRHLSDNLSGCLRRRLEQGKWDLLLQDELNRPSLFLANQGLKSKVTYPIIAIVHHLRCCEKHPNWRNRFYRHIEKSYLHSVNGFVCNSHTTCSEVERCTGGGKPCVVAYPGGDRFGSTLGPDQIEERCKQPGPLRILFLGNVIPRKGLHVLIDALSVLPKEVWQLEVVGGLVADTRYVASISRQISRAGLDDRVRLRGLLGDAGVADHLRSSHLLAVPSSYEGFGITYLEAMGFGMPVVASTAGGAKEVVTSGKEGFLVAPGDLGTLAEQVRSLHHDRRLLLRMSLKALQRHKHFPTWEQSAAKIRDFLQLQLRLL